MLTFDPSQYTVRTVTDGTSSVTFRAFEQIPYCEQPADADFQRLSIFVPEDYYQGASHHGYTLKTAPIFMPNTVGGYMPGPVTAPGLEKSWGPVPLPPHLDTSASALLHGYVVVSPGVRGRGMKNADGKNIGTAPAHIVDLKAAVRFLKANADRLPGDTEHIISNGTSAGGAISSVLGATGNHPDYLPYLEAIGAADADDSIFGASCYCPITNLDHADMAYEWEFCGINDYHGARFLETENGPKMIQVHEEMSELQQALSKELKSLFAAYLNSLNLKDADGNALKLQADGSGSFRDAVKKELIASAQSELDKPDVPDQYSAPAYNRFRHMAGNTSKTPEESGCFTISNGTVTDIDLDRFIRFRTRMKSTPAFDNVAMGTPENELFCSADIREQHFTAFSSEHDTTGQPDMAEAQQIRLMNPMGYIDDPAADTAPHFRIRHGAVDRDTSLAISLMLAVKLKNNGIDTDLAWPWGLPHSGDYDLESLFAWIDKIVHD